jgi:pimeloyl-ACP methyl ester carboxylesterase
MTIRMAYMDGLHGQIHYRSYSDGSDGAGDPLILLAWSPSGGRMYEHLMPLFAARGFRVIAPDLPGYGRSHKNAEGWTIAETAADLAHGLQGLGIDSAFAVGGHISAAVVAELAIAHPERWRRIVLDGSPTLNAAQQKELMSHFVGLSPAFSPDGSHKTFVWDSTERFLREWDPDYKASPETIATQYAYMSDYLLMGYGAIKPYLEPGSYKPGGLNTYDGIARWPLVTVPTLALTAEREALRAGHATAVSLLPNARDHRFPGSHPLLDPRRGAEYVSVIVDFLRAP